MSFFILGPLLLLLLIGAVVAVFSALKGAKAVTWVLGGLLILLLALGLAVRFVIPKWITLEIGGPPGTAFVGEVVVDGQRHEIDGTTPHAFEYQGRDIEYVIILAEPDSKTILTVRMEGNYCTDTNGVKGGFKRSPPFGWSTWQGGMGPDEWDELARRLMPLQDLPDASSQPVEDPGPGPAE